MIIYLFNEEDENENETEVILSDEENILFDETDNEILQENEVFQIDYSELLNNIYVLLEEFKQITYFILIVVLLDFVFKHIKSYFH